MSKKRDTYYTEINGKPYARVPYYDTLSGKWKTKTKRVANRAEARTEAQKIKNEIAQRQKRAQALPPATFNDLLDRYPKKVPKFYETLLRENFGHLKLENLSYLHLVAFKAKREKVKHKFYAERLRGVRAVNAELEWLKIAVNYAVKRGWLARSPFHDGEPLIDKSGETARDRIATRDEIARLLAVCECKERAHLKVIILLAVDTGLRRGKIMTLRYCDIDLDKGLIDLGKPKTANKLHPRYVGITARLKVALADFLPKQAIAKDDFLIGGKFDTSWRTACQKAGIEGLHFHDLRHTYATESILAGLPKDLVMKLTGHTQDETFARYLNVDETIARFAAEALNRTSEG